MKIELAGKKIVTAIDRPRHGPLRDTFLYLVPFLFIGVVIIHGISAGQGISKALAYTLSFRWDIGWILGGLYGLGILTFGIISQNKYNRSLDLLQILSVDEDGIRLGRQGEESRECTELIHWTNIKDIGASSTEPGVNRCLLIEVHGSRVYKISWDNALAWVPSATLLSNIRVYVPQAEIIDQVMLLSQEQMQNSHTRLWLECFSPSSRRINSSQLAVGQLLQNGVYTIVRKLGAGGQGTAYLATRHPCDVEVVLKEFVLPVHKGNEIEASKIELLSREFEILSKIDHPRIVKLLDCFVEDHRGYVVLEYVSGKTLKDCVRDNGPMSESQALKHSALICETVEYLHSLQPAIIHRDITPDNLILQEDGTIKLVDFTVAHQFDAQGGSTVVGKQAYMPPEQFQGEPCPQSDVYAIAATIFFLLTGQEPEPMEPSHPGRIVDSLSVELDALIANATAFHKENRIASAHELRLAIEGLRSRSEIKVN